LSASTKGFKGVVISQVSIIDIEGSNPQIPTEFVADVGTAIPIANTLEILGDTVPAGVVPVFTTGSGNTITVNVQRTQAVGATDTTSQGLASFDSASFSVDANGFVQLSGTGLAIDSIAVDASTAPGTNPVVPTVAGLITITGGQVATGTVGANVIRSNSIAANSFRMEIQRSTAVVGSTVALNGVSHFDSARFTVDGTGFVSINSAGVGETITGDSGGALSPTLGNWNILGRSGSKTSGSVSTLTISSPPFSQVGGSATSSLNTGEFVTATATRTLPATAGLVDGDLVIFACTSANILTITANTGQTIRLGNVVTASGGTCVSTAIGDSISLRFNATALSWQAVSSIGNWTLT